MCDDYFEDDESFADLMAAASYQDSVTDFSGQEERTFHRNIWEFWDVMKSGESPNNTSVREKSKIKKKAQKNQQKK